MFKEERKEFKFEWSHVGDIELGRPNLGPLTSVAIYRLMQFTLRDSMVKHCGAKMATEIFFYAGFNSGKAVYEYLFDNPQSIDELVSRLQKILKDLLFSLVFSFQNSLYYYFVYYGYRADEKKQVYFEKIIYCSV